MGDSAKTKWGQSHEAVLRAKRRYRKRHQDKIKQKNKEYYEKNKEMLLQKRREKYRKSV